MTTIMCAVDASSGSRDVLANAAELSSAQAQLVVAHVYGADERALDEQAFEDAQLAAAGVAAQALLRHEAGMNAMSDRRRSAGISSVDSRSECRQSTFRASIWSK